MAVGAVTTLAVHLIQGHPAHERIFGDLCRYFALELGTVSRQ